MPFSAWQARLAERASLGVTAAALPERQQSGEHEIVAGG